MMLIFQFGQYNVKIQVKKMKNEKKKMKNVYFQTHRMFLHNIFIKSFK